MEAILTLPLHGRYFTQQNEVAIGALQDITKTTDKDNDEIENLLRLKIFLNNPVVILKIRMQTQVLILEYHLKEL